MGRGPLIYVIAGEPSGDLLGGRLIAALKGQADVTVRGIGGPRMIEQGLVSRIEMGDLAVMGLIEVLPHIRRLKRHIRETVEDIRSVRPDVLVTIDSPGFCHRVSQALRNTPEGADLPIVHYVAPTVWAWKPKRAEKVAAFLDRLLVILPFEPPFFEKHGLETHFVGHSAVEVPDPDPAAVDDFRRINGGDPLMVILPGSRKGEVRRLLPVFLGAYDRLKAARPNLQAVIPAVEGVASQISGMLGARDIRLVANDDKPAAFAAADVALSAGGTAILELALAGVPTVAAYRVAAVSAFLARRMLTIDRYSLPNLILGRDVVPEIYQDGVTAERLAGEVETLLSNPNAADAQHQAGHDLRRILGGGDEVPPSSKAAMAVLEMIPQKKV